MLVVQAGRASHDHEERQDAEDGIGNRDEFQEAVGQPSRQPKVRDGCHAAGSELRKHQEERKRQGELHHALAATCYGNGIEQGHSRRYRLGK